MNIRKSLRYCFFALFGLLILGSCDPNRVVDDYYGIPDTGWSMYDSLRFSVDIRDSLHAHNIYINLRTNTNYPYSNLYLFVTSYAPNGQWIKDTLDCILADTKGKWYGSGVGDIRSLRVPFKQNILFPECGVYRFEMVHGMRDTVMTEVSDIGIRIEKVKP